MFITFMFIVVGIVYVFGVKECADQRLKRCTEILQNIKALKLFVWERLMAKRAENTRQTQLSFLFKAACFKAAMSKHTLP